MKAHYILLLAITLVTSAQAQKVAHLDYDSLLSAMPETKMASETANAYLSSLDAELTAMQQEFKKKEQTFLSESNASEFLKSTRQKELEQLQKRIEDFKTQARQDYGKRQIELTTPIMEKAQAAVKAVAKELGYKYVLDKSRRSTFILYSEESDNILGKVLKKLESMPPANLPVYRSETK